MESIQEMEATATSSTSSQKAESRGRKIDKLREKIRGKLQSSKPALGTDTGNDGALVGQLEQRKLRKKGATGSSSDKDVLPSAEEAYDFFTSTWDSDLPLLSPTSEQAPELPDSSDTVTAGRGWTATDKPADEAEPHGPSTERIESAPADMPSTSEVPPPAADAMESEEHEQPHVADSDDSTKLMVGDILKMDDHWQLVEYIPAIYSPFRERIAREASLCYVPSSAPVPVSEKLPQMSAPRNLADEGFFVGKPPRVAYRNRCKMERRLVNNKEFHWFNENGEIIALPNTIDDNPASPTTPELDEPLLQTEYRKAILDEHSRQLGLNGPFVTCQLNIDVGKITFGHHHLFSQEHVLASKLSTLHREFCHRREAASAEYLNKKLEVLRSAVASVHDSATENVSPDQNVSDSQLERLQMYQNEIRLLRQQLNRELLIDRTNLKAILHIWKDLKNVRERQGHVNTSLQLQIVRKEVNRKDDLEAWSREIEGELSDEKRDYETRYAVELEAFRKKMKRWKHSRSRRGKSSSSKRSRASQSEVSPPDEPSDGEDVEQEVVTKPEAPVAFDEVSTREIIETRARSIRRNPGEPMLFPTVSHSAVVTSAENCPRGEQRRRDEVSKCKLFIKILYNDKEVTKTSAKQLNSDFSVVFGEIFSLQISQFPRSISLQIVEAHPVNPVQVAVVFVPLPALHAEGDDHSRNHEDHQFSSARIVQCNHDGVGSGIQLVRSQQSAAYSEREAQFPLTNGVLSCCTTWVIDPETLATLKKKELRTAGERQDPIAVLGVKNITDPEKLKEWLQSSMLDPNDPTNARLLQHIKNKTSTSLSAKNYFRLEQLQEEFNFVENDDFLLSRRFKLIGLRERQVPEFRHWHMIPLRERDIPNTVFEAYERRLGEEKMPPVLESDVDSYRKKVTEYLSKMREQVWKRYQVSRHQKELADVVTEEQIPDIGSLGTTLAQLTERRRPLRPVRRERKRVTAQNVGGAAVSILVNVAGALNVPIRSDGGDRTARLGLARQVPASNFAGINECQVSPVVEITFQHTTISTNTSSGPNPCWNQDLQWEFRPPNDDFSLANLQTIKEVLYFNLYDEVVVDILQDDRDRESHVHHRIERHWLGTLQIPFLTLYLNTRIEGTFKIGCPPFLLGYTRDQQAYQARFSSPSRGPFSSAPLEKDHTYLTVFITLEPTLPLPEILKEKFDSSESVRLLQRAEQFKKAFTGNFPKREAKTTVIDITGKSVFVTRFLRPLAPPDELLGIEVENEDKMNLVARFVSLIPVISDVAIFPGICDIWTTSEQFLNMLVGDQEEHAVLLCNYFLFLKQQAWLVLGFAIPEGPTVYVLTKENLEFKIWNPCTGECFSASDSFCPMQSIGSIINPDNVWLNVQQSSEPARMVFDFTNKKNWQPFFVAGFPNPGITSIQPETITYHNTDSAYVDKLQEKIEKMLRTRLMKWRERHRTSWNRHCSQVLHKILLKMEKSKYGQLNEEEINLQLQNIIGVYKMCGFPLCVPYTDMATIAETVFATGVHRIESSNLEFALSVHVHAYPQNIVAVWIYVASLTKR